LYLSENKQRLVPLTA